MSRKQFHLCEQCQEPTNKRRTRNSDGLLVCHFCKDHGYVPLFKIPESTKAPFQDQLDAVAKYSKRS